MVVVIDRIEGSYAVVEFPDKTTKDIPLDKLPEGATVNDCFDFDRNGVFTLNEKETQSRKAEIKKIMDNLWNS